VATLRYLSERTLHLLVIDTARWRRARDVRLSCGEDGTCQVEDWSGVVARDSNSVIF
jgi:hypothetical protein